MRKLSIAVGLSLLFVSNTAFAAYTPVWSGNTSTVNQLELSADSTASQGQYFTVSGTQPTNKPSCANSNTLVLWAPTTDELKMMMSTITAAFLAGRQVKVMFDSGSGSANCFTVGSTSYAKVWGLQVS